MIKKVGLIGVGKMGFGIALSILRSSKFQLILTNRSRRKETEVLFNSGVLGVDTLGELAAKCDAVILCLPSSAEVETVVYGNDGLLKTAKAELIIIDCSTSLPESTLKLFNKFQDINVRFVDAPLTRTPIEALEGRLNCLVGATQEDLNRVKDLLNTFCENIIHVGNVSAGHRFKLINNSLTLGMVGLIAESINSARVMGLNLETLKTIVSLGNANCAAFQGFMKFLLQNDNSPLNFSLKNALKDLEYLDMELKRIDHHVPISTAVASSIKARIEITGAEETLLALVNEVH